MIVVILEIGVFTIAIFCAVWTAEDKIVRLLREISRKLDEIKERL